METKKLDIAAVADEAGKGMKSLFDKAKDGVVKAIDQNDDGSFDSEDLVMITDAISDAAKSVTDTVKASMEEQRIERERKALQPIFETDLDNADFLLSKLIRITDMDKKHAESEVCKGSIGHISTFKDMTVVNIYRKNIEIFGVNFYPDNEAELYYVNPTDRNSYIELDEYFDYLKIARITELQSIAQDLGAIYFKVTYKESKSSFSKKKTKATASAKSGIDKGSVDVESEGVSKDAGSFGVFAEDSFKSGKDPVKPKLVYLKRDLVVNGLINQRMKKDSSLGRKVFKIESSKTLGIKQSDATKIDSTLKAMKLSGDLSVSSEVKNESRRFFEYEIEF